MSWRTPPSFGFRSDGRIDVRMCSAFIRKMFVRSCMTKHNADSPFSFSDGRRGVLRLSGKKLMFFVVLSDKIINRKQSYTQHTTVSNHPWNEFHFAVVDSTFQDKLTFEVIPRFQVNQGWISFIVLKVNPIRIEVNCTELSFVEKHFIQLCRETEE